jgi:hypothetical protein
MKIKLTIYALVEISVTNGTPAQLPAGNTVPVTIENYNRAQTDVYFAGVVKERRVRPVPAWPPARPACPAGHRPAQSRHVVFVHGCRSGCGSGDVD